MTKQNPRFSSPWKLLALAILGCFLGAVVLVGGLVYWVASSIDQAHNHRPAAQTVEVRRPPAPQPPPPEAARLLVVPLEKPQEPITPPLEEPAAAPKAAEILPGPTLASTAPAEPAKVANAEKENAGGKKGKPPAGEDIFSDAVIPRLQIEIPREGVAGLRRSARTYVKCTIREGAMVYTNVAIRLKGGPGSFRQFDDTPSLTVNFDHFAEGQTFHRLKKIHLNSSVQDRTLLSEEMSRLVFNEAGVPTPRAGHAVVSLNGRDMGVYVLIEGMNKQFLKRHFTDVTGNVYDGKSGKDVTDSLPTNSGDNPKDKSRLQDLAAAARQPVNVRLASLEKVLDVDRFLSFVAMETILCHWDGYTVGRNNYRIYHDRDKDKMVFIPQGMDQTLGGANNPIFPRLQGLVSRAALEIPEVRQRYEQRVAELSTNVLKIDAITSRIRQAAAKIEEALAETDPQAAAAYRPRANSISRKYQQRLAFLQRQFSPSQAPTLLTQEPLKLTDWEPKTDLGEARFSKEKDPQGVTALHISANSDCTASFRTHVQLPRGRYRFEARLKTKGVELDANDQRAGAGLRVSRHRVGQKNAGDRDWTPTTFEVEVKEDQNEVELICELRANKGDVWFDLNSLQLSRR